MTDELNGVSESLTPSVQRVSLPAGVYLFSLRDAPLTVNAVDRLASPAFHVAQGPIASSGSVEFFSGPATIDRWLMKRSDRVTVRVTGGTADLMLTSLYRPGDRVIDVHLLRIDAAHVAQADAPGLQTQVMAHLRHFGDLYFKDEEVASLGSGIWIEAVQARVCSPGQESLIETRAITYDGFETPWLGDDILCGSRGRKTPLVGLALRVKDAFAARYSCSYVGQFSSGRSVGPVQDGAWCRSDLPNDPLEGFKLRVLPRS